MSSTEFTMYLCLSTVTSTDGNFIYEMHTFINLLRPPFKLCLTWSWTWNFQHLGHLRQKPKVWPQWQSLGQSSHQYIHILKGWHLFSIWSNWNWIMTNCWKRWHQTARLLPGWVMSTENKRNSQTSLLICAQSHRMKNVSLLCHCSTSFSLVLLDASYLLWII